jgi:hypothetical protein
MPDLLARWGDEVVSRSGERMAARSSGLAVMPGGAAGRTSAPHRRHTEREGSAWCRGLHTESNLPSPLPARVCTARQTPATPLFQGP